MLKLYKSLMLMCLLPVQHKAVPDCILFLQRVLLFLLHILISALWIQTPYKLIIHSHPHLFVMQLYGTVPLFVVWIMVLLRFGHKVLLFHNFSYVVRNAARSLWIMLLELLMSHLMIIWFIKYKLINKTSK